MLIIPTILHGPKKKEHSNDLRTLVIRQYRNGDSLSEAAAKTLLSRLTAQHMVDKYKSTKCIGHLFGRGRKRENEINNRSTCST